MDETISATEAKRNFFRMLRAVREGRTYTITSRGRAVATIEPVLEEKSREAARKRLMEHLKRQPAVDVAPWTRSDLYDE
jgi:prevent-host-death family protein